MTSTEERNRGKKEVISHQIGDREMTTFTPTGKGIPQHS
jgi:hypothetical protein